MESFWRKKGIILTLAMLVCSGLYVALASIGGQDAFESSATLTLTSNPTGPVVVGTNVTFIATHSCSSVAVSLVVTGGDPDPMTSSDPGSTSASITADRAGVDQLIAIATSSDGQSKTLRITIISTDYVIVTPDKADLFTDDTQQFTAPR